MWRSISARCRPAIGLVRDGKVRALAVTGRSARRSFPICDRRRIRPAGYAAVLHYGIVAAGRHAKADHRQARGRVARRHRVADVQQRIAADGAEVMGMTPDEYAADIDREETKWSDIVRRSGAKAQ